MSGTLALNRSRNALKAVLVLAALAPAAPSSAADAKVKTIRLSDGVYTKPFDIAGNGKTRVVIIGNETNPEKVVIDVRGKDAVRVRKATLQISGVEFRTTDSFAQLLAEDRGEIEFSKVRFGLGGRQIVAEQGGRIRATGNYDIVVGGHMHLLANGGVIELTGNTVITLHSVFFRAFFAGATAGGLINIEPGASFSGLASASKFHVRDYGRISSGGLGVSGLPGGWPGLIDDLGEYDALRPSHKYTGAPTAPTAVFREPPARP